MNFKTALMASALMAFAGAFTMGCGNACDDAVDHIEECGISTAGGGDSDAECTEAAECVAGCINDASCETLKGEDADGAAKYLECVGGCSGG